MSVYERYQQMPFSIKGKSLSDEGVVLYEESDGGQL